MANYVLFNKKRKADVYRRLAIPDEILQVSLLVDGGAVYASGGIQVDASMRGSKLFARQKQPILISALGRLLNCYVMGQDVVIEGDFAGTVEAAGDVELTNTARFSGVIKCNGHVVISPLVDRTNIRVQRLTHMADEVAIPNSGRTSAQAAQRIEQ